jgi:pimeloyl-ACP methyl ester carboxylesterase
MVAPFEEVTSREISWPLDGTIMDATVTKPVGKGPFAGVVMAAGSGPTDRDWNSPLLPGTNGSARLLADALATAGIASIRYDKRASGPRAMENVQVLAGKLSMQSHRDEFDGATRMLASEADVDAERIFAIANSEGTLHALNYQSATPPIPLKGLVLIGPPGRPIAEVARSQIMETVATMPDSDVLMAHFDEAIAQYVAGQTVTPDPALPDIARNLIMGLTAPINQPFSRELWTADAASLIAKVEAPILVVIGKKDVQIDWRTDGARIEKSVGASNEVTFSFPENADHVIKYEPRPRSDLTATSSGDYNAEGRSLDPDTMAVILAWLKAHA